MNGTIEALSVPPFLAPASHASVVVLPLASTLVCPPSSCNPASPAPFEVSFPAASTEAITPCTVSSPPLIVTTFLPVKSIALFPPSVSFFIALASLLSPTINGTAKRKARNVLVGEKI